MISENFFKLYDFNWLFRDIVIIILLSMLNYYKMDVFLSINYLLRIYWVCYRVG